MAAAKRHPRGPRGATAVIARLGFALYAACVDFMLQSARLLGVTYRDANAGMFFVLWPALTAGLVVVVLWQAAVLRGLRRRG